MMKKIAATALSLMMVTGLFAGCKQPIEEPTPTLIPVVKFENSIYEPTGSGMVAAGKKHSVGLRSDGTLLSAGSNENGQRNVSEWENIAYVDASDTMTVGASWDGKAYTTSLDESLKASVSGWTDIVMITAGDAHVVGLKKDGTVVAAGDNSNGQCDVSAWSEITMIAADANHTIGLKKDGTVVAVGDNSSRQCVVEEWTDVKMIDTARYHTLALTKDGTAYATGAFDLEQINVAGWHDMTSIYAGERKSIAKQDIGYFDCSPIDTDVQGVNDGVLCAVGSNHVIYMKQDGSVTTTGFNTELQCEVDGWLLRPYLRSGSLAGFAPNTTVERTKKIMSAITGADVVIKDANGEMSDEQLIHTGCDIYTGGTHHYATIAIIGDANGDGDITEADAVAVENHINGTEKLTGAYLTAATVYANGDEVHEHSVTAIREHIEGKSKILQFTAVAVDEYGEKLAAAKEKNSETVGWIKIDGTVIDHPVMYNSDIHFYNQHDELGNPSSHGAVYAYYNCLTKNNVITAHNMRKAKSNRMFHDLHHVQEYNMGSTECEAKYCDDALTSDLPDFSTYAGRTFTINIHGIEARWELFSMYETEHDEPKQTLFYNTWWPKDAKGNSYYKETEEEIQEWIDTQIERSEYDFPTIPTTDDIFITILTCGTEYGSSSAQSRLYMFFKMV